ncbi:MAG: N-acetyl-gamma-glutamyl-phosphate reductase [Maricaulaceae bacterium]|jgi:N-acetyl-gamma-glutamyl-phosphate reductase common form
MKRLGIIGARGYAGGELLRLAAGHGDLEVAYAASRQLEGEPLSALAPELGDAGVIAAPDPEGAAGAGLDACVLAMPNGQAAAYVETFDRISPETVIVDLSADFRGAKGWAYGVSELRREELRGARRIANPGCYAETAQLALAPLIADLAAPPTAIGISGWSGAGTTPSPRNDEARLADNIMPYALIGHGHEAEIRFGLGTAVNFTPHVAGYFRGLVVTAHAWFKTPLSSEEVRARFETAYAGEPLITLQDEPPEPKAAANTPGAIIGGFAANPEERRAVIVCALDNLLKGAAGQALQNLNLAFGFPETQGLLND